jgi:uridine kinase
MKNIIIHISGAMGSGKTTLGNKLKEYFKSKIIVKDLDDLLDEFIKIHYGNKFNWEKFDSKLYQSFLDTYILSQKKPLVLVGLNQMFVDYKKIYYNVHSQYNYYIKIDDMKIVKQKCIRLLTDELYIKDLVTKNKEIIRYITEDNKKFVRLMKNLIERDCGTKETLKNNKMWKKDYKRQNYKFMSREYIYKSVIKILHQSIRK